MTTEAGARTMVVFVDVDDTLVRSVGTKRIPIPAVIAWVRRQAATGAVLYCWSSGGSDYAQNSARELGMGSMKAAPAAQRAGTASSCSTVTLARRTR
jgi:predicted HAD superfamily phosphohydrolase YqeG